jgi:hypothetical protein
MRQVVTFSFFFGEGARTSVEKCVLKYLFLIFFLAYKYATSSVPWNST